MEFPISPGEWGVGIVETFDDDTGAITVRDDLGDLWRGYEYQVLTEMNENASCPIIN